MSGYAAGVRVEHAVMHDLKAHGYDVARGASSKGLADVIAVGDDRLLVISVKRTTMPRPAERADLYRIAQRLPGVAIPLVALGPASRVSYRELLGTGPQDWLPWHVGQVAS